MNRIAAGLLSGFAATGPMTAAMLAMHRQLPVWHRYPLPPRRITMNVADALGIKHELTENERTAATIAAHFGYGSAMGGVYATFADKLPGPAPARGIAWGLVVWAGSYLGILPAMDLHEPATQHPRDRNVLMIVAHIIWGATLGWLVERLANREATTRRSTKLSSKPKSAGGAASRRTKSTRTTPRRPARARA